MNIEIRPVNAADHAAWFSIIDGEWPALANAYKRWLAPDNFDAEGQQKQRLEQLRG